MTAFISEPSPATPMWSDVFEGQPEDIIQRQAQGIVQEATQYPGKKTTITQQMGKIDIRYQAELGGDATGPVDPPILGKFPDVAEEFLKAPLRWLAVGPDFKRLAFGIILGIPFRDTQSVLEFLDSQIGEVKFPRTLKEATWKVNDPTTASSVPNLAMNRIASWNLQTAAMVQIDGATAVVAPTSVVYRAKLDLDLSTATDRTKPLPKNDPGRRP